MSAAAVSLEIRRPGPDSVVDVYSPAQGLVSSVFFRSVRAKPYVLMSGTADEAPDICAEVFVVMTSTGTVRSGRDRDPWPPLYSTNFTWVEDHRGTVVGVHGYRLENGLLRSAKTWVHCRHRRRGLMSALWDHSLARWQPTAVAVYCISPVSYRAMKKIARRHSGIDWEVTK